MEIIQSRLMRQCRIRPAILPAVGEAGIPEVGLVTMVIVLKVVDLPLAGIQTTDIFQPGTFNSLFF